MHRASMRRRDEDIGVGVVAMRSMHAGSTRACRRAVVARACRWERTSRHTSAANAHLNHLATIARPGQALTTYGSLLGRLPAAHSASWCELLLGSAWEGVGRRHTLGIGMASSSVVACVSEA